MFKIFGSRLQNVELLCLKLEFFPPKQCVGKIVTCQKLNFIPISEVMLKVKS